MKERLNIVFTESGFVSYMGLRIWTLIPLEMKQIKSLAGFKYVVKF